MDIHQYLNKFINDNKVYDDGTNTENYVTCNRMNVKYHCDTFYITSNLMMDLEKRFYPSKANVYSVLDKYIFQCDHDLNVSIKISLEEFEQIIIHFNLFNDEYKITRPDHIPSIMTFLAEKNYNFSMSLSQHTFEVHSKPVLKWLYDSCGDKDVFHLYVRTRNVISDSEFICWYAKLTKKHSFLFVYDKFKFVSKVDIEQYINDTNYKITLADVKGESMKGETFTYLLNKYAEKNQPLKMYEGMIDINTNLTTKRKYLMKMMKSHKKLQKKFILLSCATKSKDTLSILGDYIKEKIPFKPFYLFPLIKSYPTFSLTLKIIKQVLNKTDIPMRKWLCYYCYSHNFRKPFLLIYRLNLPHYLPLDNRIIHQLYKGFHTVDVNVQTNQYMPQIKEIKIKERGHPYKSQINNIINMNNTPSYTFL